MNGTFSLDIFDFKFLVPQPPTPTQCGVIICIAKYLKGVIHCPHLTICLCWLSINSVFVGIFSPFCLILTKYFTIDNLLKKEDLRQNMYFETFYVLIKKIVYWLLMLNKLKFLISTKFTLMRISENQNNPTYGKVRTMDKSFKSSKMLIKSKLCWIWSIFQVVFSLWTMPAKLCTWPTKITAYLGSYYFLFKTMPWSSVPPPQKKKDTQRKSLFQF